MVDENIPCKKCGRTDLPLHYNYECPECFNPSDPVKLGLDKNRASRERRAKKKLSLNIFKPSWIPLVMGEFCKEYGQKMNVTSSSGKDFGSMKNFVSYCERDEKDPKEILRSVVQYWPNFVEGVLIDFQTKKPIMFPVDVDFFHFFKYRKEVLTWIANEAPNLKGGEIEMGEPPEDGEKLFNEMVKRIERG